MEVDYEGFLEPDFSALAFANSLVLATNTPTDTEIDLDAGSRRLGYDIEELQSGMDQISEKYSDSLLDQVSQMADADDSLKSLKGSLDHVNFSYAKLQRDFVKPYERAQKLHTALKKIHVTSSALRQLTWYLRLARQLSALIAQETAESDYQAVSSIVELHKHVEANQTLKSLQVVRSYENSLAVIEDRLKAASKHRLRNFSLVQDSADLTAAAKTLYLIEPSSLIVAIDSYLRAQVSSTIENFSKSLIRSVAGLEGAISDARNRARGLVALTKALETSKVPSTDPAAETTLFIFVRTSLDISSLVSNYWRDVASGLDARIREFTARNPAMSRSFSASGPKLKEIVRTAVVNGGGVEPNGLEVRVMVNAVSMLGR